MAVRAADHAFPPETAHLSILPRVVHLRKGVQPVFLPKDDLLRPCESGDRRHDQAIAELVKILQDLIVGRLEVFAEIPYQNGLLASATVDPSIRVLLLTRQTSSQGTGLAIAMALTSAPRLTSLFIWHRTQFMTYSSGAPGDPGVGFSPGLAAPPWLPRDRGTNPPSSSPSILCREGDCTSDDSDNSSDAIDVEGCCPR